MSLKESIIAALENLQGERIGLTGATRDQTILDCIEAVRSIPEDDATMWDDVIELQRRYAELGKSMPFTKRNMCDAVVWFRDKYNLKDGDALRIARNELGLKGIGDLLGDRSLPEPPKERMMDVSQIQLKPCPFCGSHVSMRFYPNCVVVRCDNTQCYMNGAGSFTSWKNGDTDERSAARLTNAWNNRKAAENEG